MRKEAAHLLDTMKCFHTPGEMERWKASAPRKHKPDSRCHSKCGFVGPEKIEAVVPNSSHAKKVQRMEPEGKREKSGSLCKSGERYSR